MSRIMIARLTTPLRLTAPLVVATVVAVAAPSFAAQASNRSGTEASKQSGTIVSVDPDARTLTLEEMGPWHGPRTALSDQSIALEPSARVALVTRDKHPAPGGWIGGYTESPLSLDKLHPGDFATVTLAQQGDRAVATAVDVVR